MRLKHFLSVFLTLLTLSVGQMWGASATWALVESTPTDWSGEYLIVYNANCFDGHLTSGFNGNTGQSVSISNKKITKDDQYAMIVGNKSGSTYSLKTASGYYIGRQSSSSNGVDASTTYNSTNLAVSFGSWNATNKTVKISGVGGKCLGNNSGSWKFFASSNQYVNVSLYKKVTLSSIAVKTAPTKTAYTEGENFDPSGLKITLTYSDNSTEDVTYNNSTKGNFTFSPTLTTSLQTSHASVTITYGGKTTSQAITVAASGCTNNINIIKGSESHGTFTLNKDGSQATCSGLSVVVTPSAADHYHVGSVSATTGETGTDNGDGTWTITYAADVTGESTINVVFAEDNKYILNYHDGSGDGSKTNVYEGTNLITALGTPAASCDATSTTFVGWSTTEIATKTNNTTPTYVAANDVVNSTTAAATYYAVYAKQGELESVAGGDIASGFGTTGLEGSHSDFYSGNGFKFKAANNYVTTGDISSNNYKDVTVKLKAGHNGGSGSVLTIASLDKDGNTIDSKTLTPSEAYGSQSTTYTFELSGSKVIKEVRVTMTSKTNNLGMKYCEVFHSSLSDYMTTCCTSLGQINGSVNLAQKSATLSWDLEDAQNGGKDHINSWKVEYKLSSANAWTVAENALTKATLTKTISNLDCNTDYDFRVSANVQSGYCDIEKEWTSQKTTKFTITKDETGGGGITLSPTATSVCDGDVIDVTANTPDGSHEGTGTIKVIETGSNPENNVTSTVYNSGTGKLTMPAYDITIKATYAEKSSPSVGVSVAALNFGSPKKGASVNTQTFNLTGSALTVGTLTLVAPSGYTVSPSSITIASAGNLSATEITVTPNTGTAGNFDGNISISGAGVSSTNIVALTMTVQETYTVNWYVNGTKIEANSKTDVTGTAVTAPSDFSTFVDCVPDFHFIGWKESSAIDGGSSDTKPTLVTPITAIGTANVNYYAVFAEGTPASTETVLEESLSSGISTEGWTFNNKCYTLNSAVRMSTGSDPGTMTSPAISALDGDATLTFEVKAWSSTENGKVTLSASKGTLGTTNFTTSSSDDFEEVSSTLSGGDATTTITFTGTAGYRISIKNVKVTKTVAEDFSMYYTTCPHVSRVTLSAASVENGSISFEQSGSAVTNVRTDGGEDVNVDVVPDPATGYELTGVALSGTAASHASYDAGVITIDAGTEGALTATATFAQANYTVTMAQTGGASAELSADQTNKHYNDVITVTAEDKAGYVFKGWSASPAVTFANAKALSTTFSMPNGNVTVTAAYEVIHDVAWALANTPGSGSSDSVYVKGLISKKEKLENDNTISYWISDNGQHTTGSVLEVYKGRGVNKVTFSSLDDLNVGDAVVVRGKLKTFNSTKEFDSGNYMYSRTTAAVASVAIGGSAEKTAYSPSDNTFSFAGLTATATYNTGYVKDVTAEATWTANSAASYTVAAGGDVTVRAAFGGQYDEEVVGVTYTTKTVKEIYLEYESTYTFKGMDLPKPKVYAKYVEEIDDDEITSLVEAANGYDTESTYNKNTPDNYTIKVEYESFNAEYTVQVRKIFDNEDAPHNVADATALIVASAYQSTTPSTDYMWVRGIVSGFNGTYNNRYYISDDGTATGQLYVYNGTYFNGAAFTADNKLKVGDEVILKANMLNYNGGTAELMNSQVTYQLRDPAFAFADVVAGDEFEPNFSADMTVEPTSNEGNAAFTLSSGNTDAVTIVAGKLHAVAEGDAEITASRAATDNTGSINYKAKNVTFNVHVIAERTRYAITMDPNGGSGVDPVYDNQLAGATVDLPATCPYSKANSAFAGWVVNDGAVEITDGHFTMPAAAVTIKATWHDVETCTISFMVSGSEVATADAPQTVEYTITQTADDVNGYEFVGWAESEEDTDVETVITTISSYTPAVDEDSKVLHAVFKKSVAGGEITDEITNAELAATENAYTAFTNVTISTSAIYAGKTSKSNGIQMNATSPNAIVTTTTGGILKNISIEWNSNCAADRVLDVYAKNTAYEGSADLWGDAAGTKVTSFTNGGSTTSYDFTADYAYIGVRSNDRALNIDRISITWETEVLYYTTNPVAKYNVKYRAGEAENVSGLCAADRLAAGSITLCDAPTSDDKNFAKWSDGVSLYAAGAEYTLSADVTLTATWTPKPTYNVTYNTSGSQGTTPTDATNYYEGDEVTLASASGLSNAGYFFDQWVATYVDNNSETQTLVIDDGKFTMPAFDVTVTATWARKSSDKWIKVTATSQLAADKEYIIVNTDATYAVGAQGSNNRTAAAIEESNGILTISDAVAKFTLGIEDDKYTFYQNGTVDNVDKGYLYAASSSSNYMKTQTSNDANGIWTITLGEEGTATVTATGTNTRNIMRYNPNGSSPMFSCYASNSSVQNPVVLYYKAPKIEINDNESVNVSDAAPGSDVVIHDGGVLAINEAASIGDLTVENGGKVTLSSNKLTVVGTFTIETTMASGNSGQLNGATESNFEAGDAYIDITLGAGGTNQQWHAFTVPFPVDAMNGIYDLDGNKLTNEVNYAIMDYHGDIRAQGQYGWKKYRGVLVPGTFYIMATDGYRTTYRFKKTANGALVAGNTKQLYKFEESGDGVHGTDNGWNGVGNPNLFYGKVGFDVQVLNPTSYTFEDFDADEQNFVVGTPFFIQAENNGTMEMTAPINTNDPEKFYAPRRTQAKGIEKVKVTFGNEVYTDRLTISASEDALSTYETGKDLVKMTMTNTPKVAQIFGNAYGFNLCRVYAPMNNDQAVYDLSLYAPQAGSYSIAVPNDVDATIYLTYEGSIIWDLTVSPYEAELAKGTNNGYGLMLVRKAPQVTTGVENVQGDKTQCTKVILNDHVYILRDAQLYDVTGKAVK